MKTKNTEVVLSKLMLYLLALGTFSIVIVYYLYDTSQNNFRQKYILLELQNKTLNLKTILFWNSYFGYPNYGYGEGEGQKVFLNARCPVNTCFATHDRTLQPAQAFDAVVFHAYEVNTFPPKHNIWQQPDIPHKRTQHQKYVFFLMEAPGNLRSDLRHLHHFFNWTWSYRWDSDVVRPYAWLVPTGAPLLAPPNPDPDWLASNLSNPSSFPDFIATKSKLVAWFVSNCHTQSLRESYVSELSRHISVDVYGFCGPLKCPKSRTNDCYNMLSKDYKFYLSFENSLCKDYITEKLFGVLAANIVPVVYGGANYSRVAPPMSYINTADFASPRDLAQYLKFLDKHPAEYLKYFWWKNHYEVRTGRQPLCKLCEMLHSNLSHHSYEDIHQWWSGKTVCLNPKLVWPHH